MRTLISLLLIIIKVIIVSANNDTLPALPSKIENQKVGAYLNRDSYECNQVEPTFKCKVIKRSSIEILILGGNDYKVARRSFEVSKKTIRQDYWGYHDGEYLYLNNLKHTKVGKYFKLIPIGGKYYFSIAKSRKSSTLDWFLGAGMVLGGIPGGINTMKRLVCEYDPQTHTIVILDNNQIARLIKSDKELHKAYLAEKKHSKPKVMFAYIEEYEKKLESN